MRLTDFLLNMAGFECCPVCKKWTADWVGWHEDTSVCAECHDVLLEAAELTEDDK